LTAEDLALLRLWSAYANGGMGVGHLPGAGGYGDQAAGTMSAIEFCSSVQARIRKRDEDFTSRLRGEPT
jgi:hypothetical protein